MDKSTYTNTLCIGEHGAAPGKELAEDLGNYVVNLTTTRIADIDKTVAIRYLKHERRKFEKKINSRDIFWRGSPCRFVQI